MYSELTQSWIRFPVLLFFCIFLYVSLAGAAELSVILESENYSIQRTQDGDIIGMEGFHSQSTPGKPELPVKNYLIGLPPGSKFQSLQITGLDPEVLAGTFSIKPASLIFPIGDPTLFKNQIRTLHKQQQQNIDIIYNSDAAFPAECVQLYTRGSLGNFPYVGLSYYPFCYHAITRRLIYYEKAEIIIKYDFDVHNNIKKSHVGTDFERERVSQLFYNFKNLEKYFYGKGARSGPDPGLFDYIIITSTPLLNAITISDFIDWKKTLGYNIKIVLISDPIITTQAGRDLPQKIRSFLRSNYLIWGIKYVLIVGDHETIPMRYTYPDATNHTHFTGVPGGMTGEVPTDYYYADLSDPDDLGWDLDGDGYYGEYGEDSPDLLAEVYVGRIPVDDATRITYALNKLVKFEQDTGTWKNSALHAGAFWYFDSEDYSTIFEYDGSVCMNEIETNLMSGWTISHYSEQDGLCPSKFVWPALTETAFTTDWRTGQYSIINWGAHGHTNRAARKVWSWDDGDSVPESGEMSWINFISRASNVDDDYPSFVFAISCMIGCPEKNTQGRIGVDFLTKPGKGTSIGVVGASRTVYGKRNWPVEKGGGESMCYEFNRHLINGPAGPEPAGNALYNSKFYCYSTFGFTHFSEYWNNFGYNLFGDPSLVREGIDPPVPVFGPNGVLILILMFPAIAAVFYYKTIRNSEVNPLMMLR